MATHTATIAWNRTSPDFLKGKYSREHTWTFDGGLTVPASPSPSVVPVPYSNPANVDPEEAFVASISSCHMLTFLYLASRQGFQVDSYRDEAVGEMGKNDKGVPWVSVASVDETGSTRCGAKQESLARKVRDWVPDRGEGPDRRVAPLIRPDKVRRARKSP